MEEQVLCLSVEVLLPINTGIDTRCKQVQLRLYYYLFILRVWFLFSRAVFRSLCIAADSIRSRITPLRSPLQLFHLPRELVHPSEHGRHGSEKGRREVAVFETLPLAEGDWKWKSRNDLRQIRQRDVGQKRPFA